ncbi:hypothetical protein ACFL2Q_16255 [Thermodesulfobacteriota bacterium]
MRFPTRPVFLVCLIVAVTTAFGCYFFNEDLYMALCAGRDVIAGHLAEPDQWSFTTDGRVWVNQGWLSGLLYYLSYLPMGELGPLLIKGGLFIICLLVICVRCGWFIASLEVRLIAMTIGALSVAPILSIRAENFGVLYFVLLTTMLTAPRSWGIGRQLAGVVIMLLWSNSHGTFMVGFVLLGLKPVVELIKGRLPGPLGTRPESGGVPEKRSLREPALWALAWVLCVPIMAFANPFGIANLLMPFQQVGAETWTGGVPFWSPLIQLNDHGKLVFYSYYLTLPFIFAVLLMIVILVWTAAMVGISGAGRLLFQRNGTGARADLLMEALIATAMILLTFRFGRTVVFSGLAVIPLLGVLIQAWLSAMEERRAVSGKDLGALGRFGGPAVSVVLLTIVVWFFSNLTLPLYLPFNPLVPESSPTKRALGTLTYTDNLSSFLTKNGFKGRVYAPMELADVLFLKVPDVKVFLDCRAQSIYTDAVLKEYRGIASAHPFDSDSVFAGLELLDKYEVSVVVVLNKVIWQPLVGTLMTTGKWWPIYVDTQGLIFIRSDSDRFKGFQESGRLDTLWYPDMRSKVLSLAFLHMAANSELPEDVKSRLKEIAAKEPNKLIYRVLSQAGRDDNGCMTAGMRSYLWSEYKRLGKEDFIRAGGMGSVLVPMLEILNILQVDARSCPQGKRAIDYTKMRSGLMATIYSVRREFSPWLAGSGQ